MKTRTVLQFLPVLISLLFMGCKDPVSSDTTKTNTTKTDTVVFRVLSVAPTVNVPIASAKVVVTFSKPLNPMSMSSSSVQIMHGDTVITCGITVAGEQATLSLNHLQRLTTYTGIVTMLVTDTAGKNLSSEYRWNFTTELGDTVTFRVTGVTPTVDVSTDTTMIVSFSKELDVRTLASPSAVKIMRGDTVVSCSWPAVGNQIFLSLSGLNYGTTYTGIIAATVADTKGEKLSSEYRWTFTTKDPPAWTLDAKYIMTDVAVDGSGNVYVSGYPGHHSGAFICRFSSAGQLIWLKTIVTTGWDNICQIIILGGNIYLLRNDSYTGLGPGRNYVESYSNSGILQWSTCIASEDMPTMLKTDGNFLYAMNGSSLFKLDQSGSILKERDIRNSSLEFDNVAFTANEIFVSGGGAYSFIEKLDYNLQLIWEKTIRNGLSSEIHGIICFPSDSLILTAESHGNPISGEPYQSSVVSYKMNANGGLDTLWSKDYDQSYFLTLEKVDDASFFVFSNNIGNTLSGSIPVKMSLNGNITWTISAKASCEIALSDGSLFLVNGSNAVTICKP